MAVLEQLKHLSDERFLAIYEALSERGFGPLDAEVAKILKFRPQAIRKLPMETRARRARTMLEQKSNAELCYELFGSYLVKTKKGLVTGFLDATGVEHEDGMISDVDASLPDEKKIETAAAELEGEYDPEDVTLYMALCVEQWPDSKPLEEAWRKRCGASVSS